MVSCEICNREFKTQQALSGHWRFKHADTQDSPGPTERDTQMASKQDVSNMVAELKEILERAEGILKSVDDGIDQILQRGILQPQEQQKRGPADGEDKGLKHLCDDVNCNHCQTALQNYAGQVIALFRQNVPGVAEAHDKFLADGEGDDDAIKVTDDDGQELFRIVA